MADDNIFGNLSTPQWNSPAEASARVGPFAESIARDYTTAYFHAKNNASADARTQALIDARQQQFQQKQQIQQNAIDIKAKKLAAITPQLVGAKTPAAAWDVVSQNPQWLVDPDTGPTVSGYLKTQASVAAAQKNSTAGAIAIADNASFLKQLTQVDPLTRSQIQGMKPNDDGSPSPMMIQTVGTALAAQQADTENQKTQAEINALNAGGQETTTINGKGVSQVIKPAPAPNSTQAMNSLLMKPDQMTLPDGSVITRGAGSRQWFKTPANSGAPKELSMPELRSVAKTLSDKNSDDPNAASINSFLTGVATNQVNRANQRMGVGGKTTAAPAASAAPTFKSPADVKAAVAAGTVKREDAVKILQSQFGYQ